MRIRPIFWCILVCSCLGIVIFAATVHIYEPAEIEAHLASATPVATSYTTIELRLSDPEGIPIEQAQVMPSAHMTNMEMAASLIRVQSRGQGVFIVQLKLYMAGPWEVDITARADGFDVSRQTLLVQVL